MERRCAAAAFEFNELSEVCRPRRRRRGAPGLPQALSARSVLDSAAHLATCCSICCTAPGAGETSSAGRFPESVVGEPYSSSSTPPCVCLRRDARCRRRRVRVTVPSCSTFSVTAPLPFDASCVAPLLFVFDRVALLKICDTP